MRRFRNACLLSLFIPLACLADLGEDLLAAVRKSDVARVKALLEQGADVNTRSPYGATPLFFAADRGNIEIVKILLDHGADVKVKDTFYGASALTWASMKSHADVIRLLLNKGAPGADDVLMAGASEGNAEMVKAALEHRSDIKPEQLSSALAIAIKENHPDVADLLKGAGVAPPVRHNFQIDPNVLQSYAGTYGGDDFQMKFDIANGKLTGGAVGRDRTEWDAVDPVTFQHPEAVGFKLTFNSENGKVVSVSIAGRGDKPTVLKKVDTK